MPRNLSLPDPVATAIEARAVRLIECPPGLFRFGDTLGFRSEYATVTANNPYQPDAYVVESGEYFHGGAQSSLERSDLMVEPLPTSLIAAAPDLLAALDALLNAKALEGVREVVAGWNGENRPEGPHTSRHPDSLGATLPKTNCGAVYALDEAMQRARDAIAKAGAQ